MRKQITTSTFCTPNSVTVFNSRTNSNSSKIRHYNTYATQEMPVTKMGPPENTENNEIHAYIVYTVT